MVFLLNSLNERAARLTTAAVIGIAMMYGCAAVAEEHDHEDLRAEIQFVFDTFMRLDDGRHELNSLFDEHLSLHSETLSQHESRLSIIDERLSRHERRLSLLNEALSVGADTRSTHQEQLSLLGEMLDMLTDRVERLEAEREAERGQ